MSIQVCVLELCLGSITFITYGDMRVISINKIDLYNYVLKADNWATIFYVIYRRTFANRISKNKLNFTERLFYVAKICDTISYSAGSEIILP